MSDNKLGKIEFSDVMSQFTQAAFDNNGDLLRSLVKLEAYCNKHLSGLEVHFDVTPLKADSATPEYVVIGYKGACSNEPVCGQIAAFIKNPQDETPVLSFTGGKDVPCSKESREEMLETMTQIIAHKEACNNAYKQMRTLSD